MSRCCLHIQQVVLMSCLLWWWATAIKSGFAADAQTEDGVAVRSKTTIRGGSLAAAAAAAAESIFQSNEEDDDAATNVAVTSLTVEYMENPMGVDKPVPRVSWKLQVNKNTNLGNNARRKSRRNRNNNNIAQHSYQLHVKKSPKLDSDDNSMECCGWIDCGWVTSNQMHLVPFQCETVTPFSNEADSSDVDIQWKVSVRLEPNSDEDDDDDDNDDDDSPVITSETAHFRTAIFGSWDAKWITGGTLLRKEFIPPQRGHYATLYVSGIGYNHVFLNGEKIGDHQLDPGWTDFSKRVWYSSYDVTEMLLKNEKNDVYALSIMLGNGWWSCGPSPGTNQPMCSNDPPQLILQLQVDGKPVVVSDETWNVSNDSPVQYNSLYNGETYDARVAERINGWKLPGYNVASSSFSSWTTATPAESVATRAKLVSQLFPPIRHVITRPPASIKIAPSQSSSITGSSKNMTQVIDFGINHAGVVRLKSILCPRNTEITLRHAEVLMHPPYGDYDGTTIYIDNLRTAKATDRYICSGDENGESYIPLFTQHGFRYVEITGLDHVLDLSDVEAVEMHTDVQRTSSLHFTDPLLNQIQEIVMAGLKSNLMSVQTDCPQRDERRGWMGDAALTAEAAGLSFGMGAFYTRWLDQMMDAQSPNDGAMPNFVPPLNGEPEGAPNWQTAYVMILWVLSVHYGDQEILVRHHESIVKYFYFLEMNYNQTGMAKFREKYGDWCPPPPHPKAYEHLTGAFAFLGDLKLGMELFGNSPHPDAPNMQRRLKGLFDKAAPEFHDSFYNMTTGVYMSGLQTEQALPLYLGVVPEDVEQSVLTHLISDIEVTNGGHTTSGIVGIKYAMEALSMLGRGDVALDLALQTTYPSWGYMLQNQYEPATTVWELWNGDTNGPGMNSRNHHMFGSVSSWLYKYVAGITALEPGFSRVQIKPNILRLDGVTASVVSPYGDIELFYSKRGLGTFGYDIILPPGTTAIFLVPIAMNDKKMGRSKEGHPLDVTILENGKLIWSAVTEFVPGVAGVLGAKRDGHDVRVELANGFYHFEVSIQARLDFEEVIL